MKPFSISRIVKAPIALVYKVQTEPAHLEKWLSPAGFKTTYAAMDFRVGGTYHYRQEGPGGLQLWGLQTFREIAPNEKIVLIQSFSDKDGGVAPSPMAADWPLEILATTTFEDVGDGKTRITITWQPYNSDEAGHAAFDKGRAGMEHGFGGVFDKLETYLESLQK